MTLLITIQAEKDVALTPPVVGTGLDKLLAVFGSETAVL